MTRPEWINLLRRLPTPLVENAILGTSGGAEIAVHSIVRVEEDYLVIRGRLTGTTENACFYLLPFERVNLFGFPKGVKEPDLRALFGSPAAPPPAETPAAAPPEAGPAAAPEDASATGTVSLRSSPNPVAAVNKAALLERLRARRPASDDAQKPGDFRNRSQ
jgi:hypothetical protein